MRRITLDGFTVAKWLLYLFFAVFLFAPLLVIALVSFTGEPINLFGMLISLETLQGTVQQILSGSFDSYREFFDTPRYQAALANSVGLAVLVTILTTLLCIPMAYAFAKTTMPFKKIFGSLITIPLVMPTFIFANATIIMFGQTGWVTNIWETLTGQPQLFNPHSMSAIVFVQVFSFFPYAFWPMVAAFKVGDISLEEAARNMGAKSWYIFFSVISPLAFAGIVSSMLLVFTVSFSDFGSPIVLAPMDLNLIVVQAYREMTGFSNWAGSSVLTVIMIIVAALFFVLQRWVTKKKQYGVISGKPKQQKLNDSRIANTLLATYMSVVLFIPTLILLSILLSSFATTWGHGALPDGLTFDKYRSVFSASSDSILNSLMLASGTLVLSVVIATLVSYLVVRKGSSSLDFMSSIPLVIPGIGLGIAFIQAFNNQPIAITGTALILIFAYTIRRMPYMIRSTMATMMAIRRDLEEAAEGLGASRLYMLATIVAPLLAPGIAAGAILVFVTVVKETSITILLATSQWEPMSLTVFQHIMKGEYYHASAMAVLIIILVMVLQLVAQRLTTRKQVSQTL